MVSTQKILGELYAHCLNTYRHSLRVGDLLYQFACFLELPNQEEALFLGYLHDAGKLNIPAALLNKKQSLTKQEFEMIKLHTVFGEEITKGLTGLPDYYSSCIRFHHENWDSSGYFGLTGEQAPLLSRMIRIVDSYDTMLYGRIYQKNKPLLNILDELNQLSGKAYDPFLVEQFTQFLRTNYLISPTPT